MALPKLQVIHCNVDLLQPQLEPLVEDYSIVNIYYYPRGDETWCVVMLGKNRPQPVMMPQPGGNFRPR